MSGQQKLSGCQASPRRSAGERLLEVATDLFYRRGIRAVGVDEIVTETGVTKPTLYRAFASKEELVAGCLLKTIAAMRARHDALASEYRDDPLGEIRAIIQVFAADIATPDYRGCAVMNAAVEFPEANHPVRQVSEASKAELRARLGTLTRRFEATEPDVLADGLTLLIEGASACRHTSGSQGPAATLMKAADALLDAYSPAKARD